MREMATAPQRATRAAPTTVLDTTLRVASAVRAAQRVEGDGGFGGPHVWEATASKATAAPEAHACGRRRRLWRPEREAFQSMVVLPAHGVRRFRRNAAACGALNPGQNSSPWWLPKASKIWGHTFFFLILHVNPDLVVCVLEFPIGGTRTAMVLVLAS
jgi:hypothetical protein